MQESWIPRLFGWDDPDEFRRRARYLARPGARPGDGWHRDYLPRGLRAFLAAAFRTGG
ncbi:MAG: hypothetical protein AB1445_11155 [Bacillota bacterium]